MSRAGIQYFLIYSNSSLDVVRTGSQNMEVSVTEGAPVVPRRGFSSHEHV